MLIIKGQVEMLVGESYNVTNTHQIRSKYTTMGDGVVIWGINKDNVLTYEEELPQLMGDVGRLYDIVLTGSLILVVGVKRSSYTPEFKQELREGLKWYSDRGIKTMDVVILEEKMLGLVKGESDRTILWGV